MVRHVLPPQPVEQLPSRATTERAPSRTPVPPGGHPRRGNKRAPREARAQRPRSGRSGPAAMRHPREKPCDAMRAKTAGSGRIRRRQTDANHGQSPAISGDSFSPPSFSSNEAQTRDHYGRGPQGSLITTSRIGLNAKLASTVFVSLEAKSSFHQCVLEKQNALSAHNHHTFRPFFLMSR